MHHLAQQVLGFQADDGDLLGHLDAAHRAGHGQVAADAGGPADDAHRLRQRLDPAAAVVLPRLQAGPRADSGGGLVDDRLHPGLAHHAAVGIGPEVDEPAVRFAAEGDVRQPLVAKMRHRHPHHRLRIAGHPREVDPLQARAGDIDHRHAGGPQLGREPAGVDGGDHPVASPAARQIGALVRFARLHLQQPRAVLLRILPHPLDDPAAVLVPRRDQQRDPQRAWVGLALGLPLPSSDSCMAVIPHRIYRTAP